MLMINIPTELIEVQCYKCKTIMNAHSMSNINSDYYRKCELHNSQCSETYIKSIKDYEYPCNQCVMFHE